jgi:hypothetical protein
MVTTVATCSVFRPRSKTLIHMNNSSNAAVATVLHTAPCHAKRWQKRWRHHALNNTLARHP